MTDADLKTAQPALRALPSVDRLLQDPTLADSGLPRQLLLDAVRASLVAARERIVAGEGAPEPGALAAEAVERARRQVRPSLRRVVNATGVILHTNLGRAPISDEAAAAMAGAASAYSNLEYDLDSGERGSRHAHLRRLLQDVTGAEDGLTVNNNAGALLLALSALAAGREVIVSRGQAVEIGGGFRIPDVMRQSGARLVEVGTTNRTYLADYRDALTPATALLLRVHPSNFRIEGFVHEVEVEELVGLAGERDVGVLDDVGSGALIDPRALGISDAGDEPLVTRSVRAGAAVVCFSGDKLLGGPQAGLLVGKREPIERIRRHPLARALRIDKASLAGLEVTLRHYQKGEALAAIPIWRMLSATEDNLQRRAGAIAQAVGSPRLGVVATRAAIGGGSLPRGTVPSRALRLAPGPAPDEPAEALARRFRARDLPIVGRIEDGALLFDLRTVAPDDDARVAEAIREVLGPG